MSIIDKCLICGEKISNHMDNAWHGMACLAKLHDLIINYAEFQNMLQNLGVYKYPLTDNVKKSTPHTVKNTKDVTKKLPSTTATIYETITKKTKKK